MKNYLFNKIEKFIKIYLNLFIIKNYKKIIFKIKKFSKE